MWKRASVVFFLFVQCVELKLTAYTDVGIIQGLQADDGDYVMFLGIPYARVNDSNPFGVSVPYPKFNDVFKAYNDTVICPQVEEFSKQNTGTLDCLRLNIYVPNNSNKNKAVLFYIHGGGLVQGYGGRFLYGPKYLVRHDVIVVVINYRLGPYGFLCTNTPELPGNQGLKDQYTALKWVHDNIKAFGGDPNKITIVGHSAGSMCVDLHALAEKPRLHQQAIMQSGTAIFPDLFVPSDDMGAVKIAKKLGFQTTDTSSAISFLAKTDPRLVIDASSKTKFGPCVEKEFDGVFNYITVHPEVSEAPNVDGLNILAGSTNREWLFGLYGDVFKDRFNNIHLFRDKLSFTFDFEDVDKIAEIVRYFYLGDETNLQLKKYEVADFFSDFEFYTSIRRTLERYRKYKNTNVYQYLFSYDGNINFFKTMYNVTESGAVHADELGYLFSTELNKAVPNADDQVMIDVMTILWTNFVKYGNPTPHTTDLIPVIWPTMTDTKCYEINKVLKVIPRPSHANAAFWELFYEAYGDRLKARLALRKSSAEALFVNGVNLIMYIIVNFLTVISINE